MNFFLKIFKLLPPELAHTISLNSLNLLNKFNRVQINATIENGVDINKFNKENVVNNIIKLANNIRFKQNNDLPKNDQIGLKTSNIFGEISPI